MNKKQSKNMSSTSLIIVPGHGVCMNPSQPTEDNSWIGIFPGEGSLYLQHIKEGVNQATTDQSSLLVFSGGQTREEAGPMSEAESYFNIAKEAGLLNTENLNKQIKIEEYARDSFENLLFSIALFKKEIGLWPGCITIVGWAFKKDRYLLHRQAIKWPYAKFKYICVNNPVDEAFTKAEAGEKAKVNSVSKDMMLMGSEWVSQRSMRDPFNRRHVYNGIDDHLDEFFSYLDSVTYVGEFPWITGSVG